MKPVQPYLALLQTPPDRTAPTLTEANYEGYRRTPIRATDTSRDELPLLAAPWREPPRRWYHRLPLIGRRLLRRRRPVVRGWAIYDAAEDGTRLAVGGDFPDFPMRL